MMAIAHLASPAGIERPQAPAADDKQLRHADARTHARDQAEEFESVFLHMFVEKMFAGIKTEGPFTGGSAEATYRSMMSEEYAKSIATTGGIGLADHIYTEILKAQHIEP